MSTKALLLLFFMLQGTKCTIDIKTICTELKNISTREFQGVNAMHGALYLLAYDQMFKIPLSEQYVDSKDGALALFATDQDFENLGHWTTVPWLSKVSQKTNGRKLSRLTIFVPQSKKCHNCLNLHAIGANFDHFYYSNGDIFDYWENRSQPWAYGYLGDGTGSKSYLFRYAGLNDRRIEVDVSPVVCPDSRLPRLPSPFNGYPGPFYHLRSVSQDELQFQLSPSSPYHELLASLPVDGFITSDGHVHLWDLYAKLVYVFLDPVFLENGVKTEENILFVTKPLEDYFVCSEQEWANRVGTLGFLKGSKGWIFGLTGILILIVLIGVVVIIKVKQSNNPKNSTNRDLIFTSRAYIPSTASSNVSHSRSIGSNKLESSGIQESSCLGSQKTTSTLGHPSSLKNVSSIPSVMPRLFQNLKVSGSKKTPKKKLKTDYTRSQISGTGSLLCSDPSFEAPFTSITQDFQDNRSPKSPKTRKNPRS